jgi:hypothetical protein
MKISFSFTLALLCPSLLACTELGSKQSTVENPEECLERFLSVCQVEQSI